MTAIAVSISSTRNDDERICSATCASSPTAITETSEVSLNNEIQVLASTGRMRRAACGITTLNIACRRDMPMARAASICPLRIELMPARKVSAL
jgi:hypothetical protein